MVLHAGGMLADATIPKQSLSTIRQVFAAKVDAARHVRSSTACEPVTSTVLFSSVASLLGSAGQANYSAANGALDGLAALWAAQGSSVSSMQWGPWSGKSYFLLKHALEIGGQNSPAMASRVQKCAGLSPATLQSWLKHGLLLTQLLSLCFLSILGLGTALACLQAALQISDWHR